MTAAELRLECLKLTYSHGRDVAEAVERAQVLEQYLNLESKLPEQPKLTMPKKPVSR